MNNSEPKEVIKKQHIIDLTQSFLEGSDKFIVDVKVSAGNKIEIYIDSPSHLVIADCVNLSRHVESSLDRDKEDFELQVSSPGATEPFKVLEQYKKYIGKKITTKTTDNKVHEGILKAANELNYTIEETRREKKEIGKGNRTITENVTLTYKQTKETKSVLPF